MKLGSHPNHARRRPREGESAVPVRARDLGISVGAFPTGDRNAITDVPGVRVGHTTIIRGDSPLVVGRGPVRTGVTVIFPHEANPWDTGVFAGFHRLNGTGEMTGLEWIRESGLLLSPIVLTNTHSLGLVRDSLIAEEVASRPAGEVFWGLPVVGETWDGLLNDINGFHVRRSHVRSAMQAANAEAVVEGSVGGGTGMVCYDFKGGIGTSSRKVRLGSGGTGRVAVLVQANHGTRGRLRINGVPIGAMIDEQVVPLPPEPRTGAGLHHWHCGYRRSAHSA